MLKLFRLILVLEVAVLIAFARSKGSASYSIFEQVR